MDLLTSLTTLAAAGVPGDAPSARLAVPIGILVFFGSIYLLVRSNLGTRRGYLVLATSFFGFMIILSLFWTFGAPGTPQAVGPTYLPTQPSDAYQPTWTPFAGDSLVAERPDYAFVQDYPDGFSEVPEDFTATAQGGIDSIAGFFAAEDHRPVSRFSESWEPVEVLYAEAPNDYPVIAVTFQPPPPAEDPDADGGEAPPAEGETVTLFAFFDAGSPLFPGIVFITIAAVMFALHAVLLNADEARERRDLAQLAPAAEEEKVPAGA